MKGGSREGGPDIRLDAKSDQMLQEIEIIDKDKKSFPLIRLDCSNGYKSQGKNRDEYMDVCKNFCFSRSVFLALLTYMDSFY
jgi:hypothetical protein